MECAIGLKRLNKRLQNERHLMLQFAAHMRIQAFILVGTVLAMPVFSAEPAPTKRAISLQECIQMAMERNFDLRLGQLDVQLRRYELSSLYGAYDPIVGVGGRHTYTESQGGLTQDNLSAPAAIRDTDTFSASLANGLTPWGMTYGIRASGQSTWGTSSSGSGGQTDVSLGTMELRQPLLNGLWIDQTRMNIWVSRKALKISEYELQRLIMEKITQVEQAYYNLVSARENVVVQKSALELAERLLKENQQKVKVGALAPLDEKQAESEVAARKADLLASEYNLALQQNVLKNLICDDFASASETPFDPVEELKAVPQAFSVQDSWSKGLTLRPEIVQSRLQAEQQDIRIRYNRNQLYPSLDLVGSYSHSSSIARVDRYGTAIGQIGEGVGPSYYYGMELSFPLTRRSARYGLKASRTTKEQILLNLKKLEQQIMVDIDDAVKLAKSNLQRVDATHQSRLYAEAALDAEQKKLANGKSTSFIVLQLQKDLTSARSSEINALTDYNVALAALARAEGYTLQRHNINVSVK